MPALGAWQIGLRPEILAAFNPLYGFAFLQHVGVFDALVALGALMLVVTGGEAMYADLGHFGAQPIRAGWFGVVYPALLLNYLGQGAYLLSGAPIAGGKLFFNLVPPSLLFPMIALATMATVIASQALISGAFSLASQAVRLGLFPRINLLHTHERHAGQVYVPFVNWSLACRMRFADRGLRLECGACAGADDRCRRRDRHNVAGDGPDRATILGLGTGDDVASSGVR